MKPPKTVVERAKANGSIDRASLLLSAAYLLNSEASNLVEEAGDILRANLTICFPKERRERNE